MKARGGALVRRGKSTGLGRSAWMDFLMCDGQVVEDLADYATLLDPEDPPAQRVLQGFERAVRAT